ncbi:MAG: hypothetical protein QOE76_3099 [Frankiales bacterium]|jgi:hypothetical protein|nr:hypothetical protein [Frankiales bacterium]
MSSEVTCDHDTLLAAWCAECAVEWLPEPVEQGAADRGQTAA